MSLKISLPYIVKTSRHRTFMQMVFFPLIVGMLVPWDVSKGIALPCCQPSEEVGKVMYLAGLEKCG